ncbi:MFS general substrate transporter [Mytilinidion resinicola]|uniref:MFS general substrate transporter n=1 Tax=Mytilinidion resinicola TaxID=574789 RepID=A0A6A6YG17_9PEZI|nr:MFS general substrate transporter [Mytilinidion resinicola]KAF2807539.1 MFS general substrate transporter [Mytilinidion resinicola]
MNIDYKPSNERRSFDIDISTRHENAPTDYAPDDVQKKSRNLEDPEWAIQQKRYLRKLDFIILPMISLLYFFEYLDRGNIGNAKLYGFDDGHSTVSEGIGPGTKSLTPTQWQLTCVAYNYAGALVCRLFLGIFEGLFGTGIVYYLSLWYHRSEMGVRVFWFLGPTAIAGAFGGLMAYGIGHIDSETPIWKWLFLIEGVPGLCLGILCLWWIPDRPSKNSRFSGRYQEIAEARYHSESFDVAGKIQLKHILLPVTDWRLYLQVAVYLPTAGMLSSISGFLPTVVRDLGYHEPTKANLMTVPPYACAFVLMYIFAWSSDHYRERGFHCAALATVTAIAYALLAFLPESQLHGKYACICIAVACVYATYSPSHAWAANNFGNETKRAVGMGLYTALGNLGSIAGTWFYPTTDAPQFRKGHAVCMGLAIATASFALINSFALKAVNSHRDKKYGKPEPGISIDVTELADDSPHFRFIT